MFVRRRPVQPGGGTGFGRLLWLFFALPLLFVVLYEYLRVQR